MAQTISELEKERAQLLEAIESQAQQISGQRSPHSDAPIEHTLKDWLNAAEEVMPTNPIRNTAAPKSPNNASATTKPISPKSSKASFFGVIIMLSLLLTILGVLYIAYTSIHNELQKVMATHKNMNEVFSSLQTEVVELKNSGGKSESFSELQVKVSKLEAEITALKSQLSEVSNKLALPVISKPLAIPTSSQTEAIENNWVKMDVLDKKLEAYTHQIDRKLELIMQHLNVQLPLEQASKSENISETTESAKPFNTPSITEPAEPKIKTLNQPLVKLVKTVNLPEAPQKPQEPLKNYSPEVNWLMNEPAFNFTLQLASLTDFSSAQKMKDEKGLADAKIIPQTRNDVITYVLLMGSYSERQAADKAARSLKSNYNISPWVRKIKDLTSKVE